MQGSQIGGCQDRGAMKISSDRRAPLNIIDALQAMCWSNVGGGGQIYGVVWARIQGSTRSSSGNEKVIVGISLLGMMVGLFIDIVGVGILEVFLCHYFQNMWKVPTLHQ